MLRISYIIHDQNIMDHTDQTTVSILFVYIISWFADQDGAEPSANSVAVGNLVRLSPLLDRPDYRTKAEAIFCLFSDRLSKIPIALPEMTTALLLYQKPPEQVRRKYMIILSFKECESRMLLTIREFYML